MRYQPGSIPGFDGGPRKRPVRSRAAFSTTTMTTKTFRRAAGVR